MRLDFKYTKRLAVFLIATVIASSRGYCQIKPDLMMESDPVIPVIPTLREFHVDHTGIWLKALHRPEADLQRMAAESIALGVAKKIPKLTETIPALETIVGSQDSHPTARYAAARALIELDSRTSANILFEASKKHGVELRQLVEPVLAVWKFAPIRTVWFDRLQQDDVRTRDLILAIRGVGVVRDSSAFPKLMAIVQDLAQIPEVRLAAAESAGLIADSGLEKDSERLMRETRSSRIVNRLCALRLMRQHDSVVARQLLIELATDDESSIAGSALERLNQIDSKLVIPLVERSFQNSDVIVREQAATAYLRLPTIDRMRQLVPLLDDPHPGFRSHLCEQLERLARIPELADTIRGAAMDVLSADSWRGQEQAMLLLGTLEYLPASKRLVELLESRRPEVAVAAAWGLRKIADPQTIPAVCDRIRRQTAEFKSKAPDAHWPDLQMAHLFEACGKMKAMEAREQLLEYVPKMTMYGYPQSRGAAIWSLGWLHEGKPDQQVAEALMGRFTDMNLLPKEWPVVKQMSVVSLARMKAVEYTPELARAARDDRTDLHLRWAVQQLTGEEQPLPAPQKKGVGPSFLDPLDTIEEVLLPQ